MTTGPEERLPVLRDLHPYGRCCYCGASRADESLVQIVYGATAGRTWRCQDTYGCLRRVQHAA